MERALTAPGRLLLVHRWLVLAVLGAVILGSGIALAMQFVFAAIGAAMILFLMWRGPLIRAVVVIVGGITLLQISPGLSVEKFWYLATLVVATLFAGISIASRWSVVKNIGAVGILVATGGVAMIVALSAVIALH